jgi:hypothetical protein
MTTNDEAIAGAKEFLLQEYQSLYSLHQEAKAVGETRLNFFITFVATVSTAAIAVQSFISSELRIWVIAGSTVILIILGLATYRKMLQRRAVLIIYRRRLSRIRAWFVKYYPPVIAGLPYDTNQNIKMNWNGKNKLGSTAFSVAFINTALITLSVLALGLMSVSLSASGWIVPLALFSGIISWTLHIAWKNNYLKNAENNDQKDLERLDKMASVQPQPEPAKRKRG